MQYNPQFTVIITTFNRANYLADTLGSVVNQTFSDIEILVIDDGSTDTTEEVVKSFQDGRIKYIRTRNWGGPARPRNIGIQESKGEYIAFCDDDDLWQHDKLEIINTIIKNTGSEFIFSNVSYIDQHSNYIATTFNLRIPRYLEKKSDLLVLNNIITLSSVVVSRHLLGESRFFEDKNYIAAEDRILWHELNTRARFYYCPLSLVKYRRHVGSISINSEKKRQLNFKTLKYIQEKYNYDPRIVSLSRLIARMKYNVQKEHYLHGMYNALSLLVMGFRYQKMPVLLNTAYNILV